MIFAILLFLFRFRRMFTISNKSVSIIVLILLLGLINLFWDMIYGFNYLYNMRFITTLMFSFLFTTVIDFISFRKLYVWFMAVIGAISLLGHLFGMFTDFYYPFKTIISYNNVSYYNAYLFFATNGYSRGRNIGVFWEPGIFAIFIAIALLFLICDSQGINKFVFSILFLTLITTYSTTGYFLLALILFSFAYLRKKSNLFSVFLITSGVVILLVSLVLSGGIFTFLLDKFPRVFSKLAEQSASSTARIESIQYNLQNFFMYPIMGSGLTQANVLFSNKMSGSQTSSMTLYFAEFGLVGVYFVFLQLKSILQYREWNTAQNFIFFLTWIVLMNVEITTFFSLVYIIMFYFIKESFPRKTKTINASLSVSLKKWER